MTGGRWSVAIPLYLSLAVASGFVDLRVRAYPTYPVEKYIPGVIDGSYGAPAIYRVLVPFLVDRGAAYTGVSSLSVWYVTRLAWFFLAFLAIHLYLRTWFDGGTAITGTFVTAGLLPLTFTNSWAHPDHIPELALFTLGCWCVATKRDRLFALVLPLAALNRETSVFLVLLYAVAGSMNRRHLIRTGVFGLLWGTVYLGIRFWRGWEGYELWQLDRNIEFLGLLPANYDPYYRAYAYFFLALLLPLLYLALRPAARPVFASRAVWVVPPFLLTCLLFSSIIETRIFTPILPLLLPAAIVCVGHSHADETRNAR